MITNKQLVHKLPVEVLSWIFTLGEGTSRESRVSGLRYAGFQDLVTQVCRRWRDIAINTQELWAYIFISRPPPHSLAQLYISRAGSYPLVIDIDMRRSYTLPISRFDHKEQTKRVLQTFGFIIGCRGGVERWGSLIVQSKLAQVLFDIIGFLSKTSTPVLQFLSLTWRSPSTNQQRALQYARHQLNNWGSCSLSRNSQRPQLHHVQFNELPSGFALNHGSSMLSNLTEFVFVNKQGHPPIQDIGTFLSANPQLESLYLDTTTECSSYAVPMLLTHLQAQMPMLRSFSLNAETNQGWCFQVLQIVDAPGLEHFKLKIRVPYRSLCYYPAGKLVRYLGLGRLDGVLRCDMPPEEDISYGSPIFPKLRHLDVEHVIGHYTGVPLLLQAVPSITQITLSLTCLQALAEHPELIPNASHFVYTGVSVGFFGPMRVVASRRAAAGRRISYLRVNIGEPDLLMGILEEESNETNGNIAPLRLLVDKIELFRKISRCVYFPDSDDEAPSSGAPSEAGELDIHVAWWTDSEDDESTDEE